MSEQEEDLDICILLRNFEMGEVVLVKNFPEPAQRKAVDRLHEIQ
jgi:hypothetical protein